MIAATTHHSGGRDDHAQAAPVSPRPRRGPRHVLIRGFTPPWLWLVGALVVAALTGWFAVLTPEDWRDGRAMASAPICGVTTPRDSCLEPRPGVISGPRTRRRQLGATWGFLPADAVGTTHYDSADLSPGASGRLKSVAEPWGLFWHGELVGFYDTEDGTVITSQDFGVAEGLQSLYVTLVALAATLMGFVFTADARSRAGSWWRRPPVNVEHGPAPPLLDRVATISGIAAAILFSAAAVGFLPIALALPAVVSAGTAIATAVAGVAIAVRRHRRSQAAGRAAYTTP